MDKNCIYENFYINTVMHFMMMIVNVIVYVRHKCYVFCVFLKGFMLLVISIFSATCIHICHCQVNILIGMYKLSNMGKKSLTLLLSVVEGQVGNIFSSFSISFIFPSRMIHIQFWFKFCYEMITQI